VLIVASYFGWNIPIKRDSTLSFVSGLFLIVIPWFFISMKRRSYEMNLRQGVLAKG